MSEKPANEGYQPGKGSFGYQPEPGEKQNGYQPPSQTIKPSSPPSGGSSANPKSK